MIFWQFATGFTESSTVTVLVQVEELPFTSVTVRVTVFGPTFAQVKEVGEALREAMPQASVLALLIAEAVIVLVPPAFR